MLVPGLADVSTATIRAALQRVDIPALSNEAHIRHLEAVGALIQQLCPANTTLVGFGSQGICACIIWHVALAVAAVASCGMHCLEQVVLDSCE